MNTLPQRITTHGWRYWSSKGLYREIALLENQLLLDIDDQYPAGIEVAPELKLPARLTKGARATATDDDDETDPESRRSGRKSVRFNLNEFDDIVKIITVDARSKKTREPTNYYPARSKKKDKSRVLAIVDPLLKQAIYNYTLVKSDCTYLFRC